MGIMGMSLLCILGYLVIARATNGYILTVYPGTPTAARIAWCLAWPIGFVIEAGRGPRT